MNIFEELKQRGLVKQTLYPQDLEKHFQDNMVSFYVGFDPTADSLHIGHFTTLMMASRLQKAGHKPYILIGGATAGVGDPSGRSDMRPMLTREQINHNVECFKKQMKPLLSFEGKNGAVIVNNADWLLNLNYIDFISQIGLNLSVNKMLSYDAFKTRWQKGLTFLELNYMPMQAYDFYHLNSEYGVTVEVGGDDQWANMIEGAELIRRKTQKPAFAMTFPLLARADGKKMGKSASGAIWLDPNKTSPVEMYQFFRNIDDSLVEQQLKMLTFVPTKDILEITKYKDERINKAKELLAYEVVKIVHGKDVADAVVQKVKASFSGDADNMLEEHIKNADFKTALDLVVKFGGVKSNGEARRLIDGKAIKINDRLIDSYFDEVPERADKKFIFHKGKKLHLQIKIDD
jgi:tyrosyl-tRNA synthetase